VVNEIRIDFDACSGCKTCYNACFVDVFRWDRAAKRPIVAYPEDCAECNMCEVSCPEECIEVVVDWDKYYPPFFERSVGEIPGKRLPEGR
jgi:NAD-dependent dihydropyrimidine dehydrogenase PreA subunit